MHAAVFVISTGRCATQWLTEMLRQRCGDGVDVRHEPLHLKYSPRQMLGAGDPSNLEPALAQPILDHVADIEATLETRPYIECGFPLWSSLPYLLNRFAGRARVVHLTRHPVPVAWSWVAQQAYCEPLAPHLKMKEPLSPFDEGIRFVSYRERWSALHPYEKALFFWAEVHAFALRLAEGVHVPWLTLRYEELFSESTLQRILTFSDIAGNRQASTLNEKTVIDAHPFRAGVWCDPCLIEHHRDVVAIATRLGYDALAFDPDKIRDRYSP